MNPALSYNVYARRKGGIHLFPLMAASIMALKTNIDMNSSLPAHIWNIYTTFKNAGIDGIVMPHESPTFAAAETDSNDASLRE